MRQHLAHARVRELGLRRAWLDDDDTNSEGLQLHPHRHHAEGLRTYALHPGGIATEGFDKTQALPFYERWGSTLYKNLFAEKDVSLGAQTTLHCIGNRAADRESGRYYDDCALATPKHCDDPERIRELFALCEQRLA